MSQSKNHRVLWVLNHTPLMEWELPMLIKQGFEAYVPKLLPDGPNSRTATVTTAYDASLSIASEDLAYLNTVNFDQASLTQRASEIINRSGPTIITSWDTSAAIA